MDGFLMLAAFPLMMLANLLLDVATEGDDEPAADRNDLAGDEPLV